MENTFTIDFKFGTEVTFKGINNTEGFNTMSVKQKDTRSGLDDEIILSHNDKVGLIRFLIDSIGNI